MWFSNRKTSKQPEVHRAPARDEAVLTDTSISPAIYLTEGQEQTCPSCMKKRAQLISEERQKDKEGERADGFILVRVSTERMLGFNF